MAKVSPLQSNFGAGELTPLMGGRVDFDRYAQGLAVCKNYVPLAQGPVTRRSGSVLVSEVKTSSKATRILRFEFSTTQAYIIEVGDLYCRFYLNNGQILSGGSPYEIVTPYAEAHLFQLNFTQSADVLYITHPSYAPRKLSRTGHAAWTLTTIDFLDGPYLAVNATTTTITPSAVSGVGITLTASAALWAATDVGRLVRLKNGATWGYAKITAFTSTTVVTATVVSAFAATTASATWRLGVWSTTTGYPAVVTFHEDRLMFAGATAQPQRFDGSRTGDYENFAPSDADGTITASHALNFSLNSNDVNVIRWLTSDEKGMLAGSVGGEWVIRASSQGEALSPANVSAVRATSYGSARVTPVQVGKSTLFLQRSGRKVREMTFFFDVDGFRAPDLTVLSEHITQSGIKEMAYQKEPQSIVWCVRNDGTLVGMTYERDLDNIRVGWHRHIIGGSSDAAGTQAQVESVAVIPSATGEFDDVWIVVKRWVNGGVERYIEYFRRFFYDAVKQRDAFFVDSGLTYDAPLAITGITRASPGVFSVAAHGLLVGDKVLLVDILGMSSLNDTTYLVNSVPTAGTFTLKSLTGVPLDTTALNAYVSGGTVRLFVDIISGLGHLEGETVQLLGDGAVQPNKVVTGGAVTLSVSAATVHVGYGFVSDGQLMRLEAGAVDGTALGKTRRSHRVGFLLHRSLGLKIGTDFSAMTTIPFRRSSDEMTRAVPLFSGIISESLDANYDFDNQISFRQDQPLPSTILAVAPQMVTQDRG